MRVAVTGATGNVGSRVVAHLLEMPEVDSIVGIVRRPPAGWDERVEWQRCDIGEPDAEPVLRRAFADVDTVVHLAWQIQPARDLDRMRRTNVDGSSRVFDAAADSGAGAIVYASSIGAYAAGPKDRAVDESWPTDGIPSSSYSRHKSEVERLLDATEQHHPQLRVVRFRPGLIFQAAAASEIGRYFLGPYVPRFALRRGWIPVVPAFDRLVFQAVHTNDVARAFTRAVVDGGVSGAFNLAADPVIDARRLAQIFRARTVPTPLTAIRVLADLTYRARLQPTDAGWVDLAAASPVMSCERARTQLGWSPRHSSTDALLELLEALRHGAGAPSPVLRSEGTVGARAREVARVAARGGPGAQNP